jgi:hypothetical protein
MDERLGSIVENEAFTDVNQLTDALELIPVTVDVNTMNYQPIASLILLLPS